MNVKETNEFFEKHNIVALRADKGNDQRVDEMLALMKELGNPEGAIPFYAIYGPELDKPITADALITKGWVYESLEKAKGGSDESDTTTSAEVSETPASLPYANESPQ